MLGIGIRIEDLHALIAAIRQNADLSDRCAQSVATTLATVALPRQPVGQLCGVVEQLDELADRLRLLLEAMRSIAWTGPQSPADLELVDPLDLPIDWALAVIEKHFAQLDTASKGGRAHGKADGHVSSDDLNAALTSSHDAELLAAIVRIGEDPIAFRLLDTGGDANDTPDGTFSHKDLTKLREHGVDDIPIAKFLHAASALTSSLRVLDTAAHGGRGDGRFATSDLRAALRGDDLDTTTRDAAELLLDHDRLLPLLERFVVRKRALAVRMLKGLTTAGLHYVMFTDPVLYAAWLLVDPVAALRLPVSYVRGAVDVVRGTATTVGELAIGNVVATSRVLHGDVSPLDGVLGLARTVQFMVRHLPTTLELALDIDMLDKDPDRWLANFVLSLRSGEVVGAASPWLAPETVTVLRELTSMKLDIASAVGAVEDRQTRERRAAEAARRAAVVRAAIERTRRTAASPPPPVTEPVPLFAPRTS